MAHIAYSENGTNPLTKLLGHNPVLLKNWMALLDSFYAHCSLDRGLQEEVRRAVAYQIGCAYCMSHGCPTQIIEDVKTKAAVDFAKKVVQVQRQITESDIELLREHFTEKEISELSAFVCYGIGLARFGAALRCRCIMKEHTLVLPPIADGEDKTSPFKNRVRKNTSTSASGPSAPNGLLSHL